MLFYIILIGFIFPYMNAPTWCYFLAWLALAFGVIKIIADVTRSAIKIYNNDF